jgi:hypothetical protein
MLYTPKPRLAAMRRRPELRRTTGFVQSRTRCRLEPHGACTASAVLPTQSVEEHSITLIIILRAGLVQVKCLQCEHVAEDQSRRAGPRRHLCIPVARSNRQASGVTDILDTPESRLTALRRHLVLTPRDGSSGRASPGAIHGYLVRKS